MADDWKPGDLALCVRGGYISGPGSSSSRYPTVGAIYTVEAYLPDVDFVGGRLPGLLLKDAPINFNYAPLWAAFRFIKVTPQEEDEFDREVIRDMKKEKVDA